MYDGYFNRELYRIFMQLSLLRLPAVMEQKATGEKVEPQEISLDMEKLTAVLKENTGNYADKRTLLAMVAKQHPEIFLNWLRSEALKDHTFISLLSELADDRMVRPSACDSFVCIFGNGGKDKRIFGTARRRGCLVAGRN